MEIKFKKIHPDAKLPTQNNSQTDGTSDTGWDVYAVEDKIIPAKGSAVVDNGLQFAFITPGYWVKVEGRSGMGFKHGIMPHGGIIDNCVPAGTLIKTCNGDIPVEQLYNSDNLPSIISYNEELRTNDIDTISEMWIVKNSELIEITTESNSVKIPPTKQIYTKRGWILAKDLTLQDEVLEY